jgi:peptidoglycan hydrolase CwlO-like protein
MSSVEILSNVINQLTAQIVALEKKNKQFEDENRELKELVKKLQKQQTNDEDKKQKDLVFIKEEDEFLKDAFDEIQEFEDEIKKEKERVMKQELPKQKPQPQISRGRGRPRKVFKMHIPGMRNLFKDVVHSEERATKENINEILEIEQLALSIWN